MVYKWSRGGKELETGRVSGGVGVSVRWDALSEENGKICKKGRTGTKSNKGRRVLRNG